MTIATTTESTKVGPIVQGASIIQFPPRPPARAAVPPEQDDRLAKALASLNTALADQKAALAAWRNVLGELKTSTSALEDSLHRYRGNLRSLGTSVSSLREKSKALEKWADEAVTGPGN